MGSVGNLAAAAREKVLGRLSANERTVGPILKFLKGREFSSRQVARGRKLKWQQRSDQQGEDQLTD